MIDSFHQPPTSASKPGPNEPPGLSFGAPSFSSSVKRALFKKRTLELERPLGRGTYSLRLLGALALHFWGLYLILGALEATPWTFFQYLSPFMGHRVPGLGEPWLVGLLAAWTLPFLTLVGVWSVRRARDAGIPTIAVLLFFVPGVNYFLLLTLASAPATADRQLEFDPAIMQALERSAEVADSPEKAFREGAVEAVITGAFVAGLIFIVAFTFLKSPYGMALFVGAPMAIGLVATITYNRHARRGTASSQLISQISLVAGSGLLLLFGIEGGLCLAMVMPLAMPLAAIGSWLGDAIVEPGELQRAHLMLLIVASPFLTAFDSVAPGPPLREITTQVVIDAAPETVWPNVVAFTELPPPNRVYFRLGIAYPMRARIEGEGVGAIRYCEFSTGAFVEPITRWEEPHRLSFDVVAQPPTMHEWSPYEIHPEHLTESLRSERGEFRLTALPEGKTLLEGTTWYRHDLMPQLYWNLWSDSLIHGIHRRVLEHIAERSEADGRD